MDLRLLELFVCVAEEGSIHGGARRLMTAQPAVSKALRKLERDAGTVLVTRSAHGITLTDAGGVLLDEARAILQHVDRAMASVRDAGRRRTITVGLIGGVVSAAEMTRSIVSAYRRQHPGLDVVLRDLAFPEQFESLTSGEIDVALLRPPCEIDTIEYDVLFDEPLVLCCNDDHPLSEAEALDVEDVLDEPMLDMAGCPSDWAGFWQLDAVRGGPARTASEPVASLAQMQMALTFEDVITPAAAGAWRLGLARPGLRAVPLRNAPRSDVAVATRRGDSRSDVRDFVACAREMTPVLIDWVPGATVRL